MLTSSKMLRAGILALGVTALSVPAMAQTGNPNNPQGSEVPNNIPPKGNIGTSGDTSGRGGSTSGTMMTPGTTGAGGQARPGGPAARDSGPVGADAPSEVPRPGPKGNIGGN
ncbi:hypothetical protein [Rhodoplanes roseus]|uniref:Translation initiation factor IF-2 n=1 Tax=Rhodoplanes roseus TaxID=29409 RepID=A0A327L571_9BRAD|nr:hypothetical protein [Rhodoplanes roseus]RAI45577.1 hypothetical protein CH341_03210 [Rhodoplanes roseus]